MDYSGPKNPLLLKVIMDLTMSITGFNTTGANHPEEWSGSSERFRESKGLEPRFIDFKRFNLTSFVESRRFMASTRQFLRTIQGVKKSRKAYMSEISRPETMAEEIDPEFWEDVRTQAAEMGIGVVGFAPVEEAHVFVRDHIGNLQWLYPNAIVLGMEMDFDAIDIAPGSAAGLEALRIYADLGIAANCIADYIRTKGHRAIACHPLGGPALYPAMAVKANLGEIGHNGLLITRKYGPRLRLAMVTTSAGPLPEGEPFDSPVSAFCDKCGACRRACPVDAILESPRENKDGTVSRIDAEKCFPQFYRTVGCSICIQSCPFHKKSFDRVIRAVEGR